MAWRHIGYVMVLYLAGLKAVDNSLREAAAIDGCNEWQAFRRGDLPVAEADQRDRRRDHRDRGAAPYDIVAALNDPRAPRSWARSSRTASLGEGGGNVGIGSAYGMVLFVLCIGFIIWYVSQQLSGRTIDDRRHRPGSAHRSTSPPSTRRRAAAQAEACAAVAALTVLAWLALADRHRRCTRRSAFFEADTQVNGVFSWPETLTLENYRDAWNVGRDRQPLLQDGVHRAPALV